IVVGDGPPEPLEVEAVARHGAHAELSAAGVARMLSARAHVERAAAAGRDQPPVYGITTGLGAPATTRTKPAALAALAHALRPSARCGTCARGGAPASAGVRSEGGGGAAQRD